MLYSYNLCIKYYFDIYIILSNSKAYIVSQLLQKENCLKLHWPIYQEPNPDGLKGVISNITEKGWTKPVFVTIKDCWTLTKIFLGVVERDINLVLVITEAVAPFPGQLNINVLHSALPLLFLYLYCLTRKTLHSHGL